MRPREVTGGPLRALLWQGAAGRTLLLHGFTGAPGSWGEVVAALPGSPTCLAPWLPGHGPDGWPPELATFDDAVDALAATARAVDPGPWAVAGYSLGGRLALRLALRHPGMVARLAVIAARPGLDDAAERDARRAADGRLAALLRDEGLEAFVAAWETLPLFATQAGLPAAALARQRETRLGHGAAGLARALEVLGVAAMPDCRPALATLGMPVTVVVGERDAAYRGVAAAMVGAIPGAALVVVPGSGHNVPLESPGAVGKVLQRGAARPGEDA